MRGQSTRLAVTKAASRWLDERGAIDVAAVSAGLFSPDPPAVYQRWAPFTAWYAANSETILAAEVTRYRADELGAPVPEPPQGFAIGMNYRAHAAAVGLGVPESDPVVFAKFASSMTGPAAVVELPSEAVDYEAELVVVIGIRAHRIARQDAWAHVAGLTLGQDLSERLVEFRGPTPQFSLASRSRASLPSGQWWSPPTSSTIPTTSRSAAPSTGSRMQRANRRPYFQRPAVD